MAKYPIRIDISKTKPVKQYREAAPITQKDLNRHSRNQGEEGRSDALFMKRKAPQVIRTTVPMRPTPTKKGK